MIILGWSRSCLVYDDPPACTLVHVPYQEWWGAEALTGGRGPVGMAAGWRLHWRRAARWQLTWWASPLAHWHQHLTQKLRCSHTALEADTHTAHSQRKLTHKQIAGMTNSHSVWPWSSCTNGLLHRPYWIEIDRVTGIILAMGSANERRRYIVTSSLIGWAHTQNDPWVHTKVM